jgi:hypothetical protein
MKYNLEYHPTKDFNQMTEEELMEYLDDKAEWIQKKYITRPLTNYHKKLARMMSGLTKEEDMKKLNEQEK